MSSTTFSLPSPANAARSGLARTRRDTSRVLCSRIHPVPTSCPLRLSGRGPESFCFRFRRSVEVMTSTSLIPVRRLTRICTGHLYPGRQAAPLDYRNIISFASDSQHTNTLDQRTRRRMQKDIIFQDSKCLIFPSRYLYPFRIRVIGPLVVSSAFLSWELLARPLVSFLFDLARRGFFTFSFRSHPVFSQRSRLNRLGPRAQFLFLEESTHFASDPSPTLVHTTLRLASPRSGFPAMCLLPPTRTACFRNSRNRHFLSFSLSITSTLPSPQGMELYQNNEITMQVSTSSRLSRLRLVSLPNTSPGAPCSDDSPLRRIY